MMFYTYDQNNSGGSFDFDESDGITHFVIIEAENHVWANKKAEDIGLYWDGCDTGRDCECCGDRWYPCDESDGNSSPEVYGEPPACAELLHRWMDDGKEICVHYANGTKEWF